MHYDILQNYRSKMNILFFSSIFLTNIETNSLAHIGRPKNINSRMMAVTNHIKCYWLIWFYKLFLNIHQFSVSISETHCGMRLNELWMAVSCSEMLQDTVDQNKERKKRWFKHLSLGCGKICWNLLHMNQTYQISVSVINAPTPTWNTFLSLFIKSKCCYMFRALLAQNMQRHWVLIIKLRKVYQVCVDSLMYRDAQSVKHQVPVSIVNFRWM
jgi:hypothetical protein